MGRKCSSVNSEWKRYLTCKATVPVTWTRSDLHAHTSVCTRTSKVTQLHIKTVVLPALHGDVINSIKHSRKINLQAWMHYMELSSCRVVVNATSSQAVCIDTILIF